MGGRSEVLGERQRRLRTLVGQRIDDRRAYHDRVCVTRYDARLICGANAEPDGDRQIGLLPNERKAF
jgi:hypothetical protein